MDSSIIDAQQDSTVDSSVPDTAPTDAGIELYADNVANIDHLAASNGRVFFSGTIQSGAEETACIGTVSSKGSFASFVAKNVQNVSALVADDEGSVFWAYPDSSTYLIQGWDSNQFVVPQTLAQSIDKVASLAIHNGYLYWTAGRAVRRINSKGGAVEDLYSETSSTAYGVMAIDTEGTGAWISEIASGNESSISHLQFSPPVMTAGGKVAGPIGLLASSGGLFVRDSAGIQQVSTQNWQALGTWPVQGTNGSIASDASSVYVVSQGTGIVAISKAGSGAKTYISSPSITSIAVDTTKLYWAEGTKPAQIKVAQQATW